MLGKHKPVCGNLNLYNYHKAEVGIEPKGSHERRCIKNWYAYINDYYLRKLHGSGSVVNGTNKQRKLHITLMPYSFKLMALTY